MARPRKNYQLDEMRKSGYITAFVLKKVLNQVKEGVSCLELDQLAESLLKRLGGEPSFKTVKGYLWSTCITINEQVVHGIPTQRILKAGDLISVDLGTVFKGWHTDAAWTVLVKGNQQTKEGLDKEKFLQVGEEALWKAVDQAVVGLRVGDISHAIQLQVEGAGYSVVRSLVGHGVGRVLHDKPEIPGYGKPDTGIFLKKGMTLAIEVIYTSGGWEVVLGEDGWTFYSADHSLAGLFEMTVVVGKKKAEVLTDWRNVP